MEKYRYRLTEEIARWSFEVKCKQNKNWYIAFSNPTAGPWKVIKASDKDGNEGMVYKFDSKENRPDIVLINDKMKLIIIIEAKANYLDLCKENQIEKSIKVVSDLSKMLKKERSNQYWGKRYMYDIFVGLLWGSEYAIPEIEKKELFDSYQKEISKYNNIDKRIILGIEVLKNLDGLSCFICGKNYENNEITIDVNQFAEALLLPTM